LIEPNGTIVALATPPGRSGIGVIRLSGPAALSILRTLIAGETFDPTPNFLHLRKLIDPATSSTLDEALVCYFRAPHSFTGEDVVELHCHGSPILLRAIIDATLTLDARMAHPGEFSLRAVANGRMTLTEAEAIRDLIDAQTEAAVLLANRQLKGEISHALQPLKEQLLNIIVRLESSLEFVEDDLPTFEVDRLLNSIRQVRAMFEAMASTFHRGKLLRDGLRVTLIGRPNAGKSSLFNSLLGCDRAIVHHVPGTTRDAITELIGVDGVPLLITDTAGLRVAPDQVEAIGVDRTKREAADSDLLIVVIDGSEPLTDEDRDALLAAATQRHIIALNKSDLLTFSESRLGEDWAIEVKATSVVSVSATCGDGLDRLRAALLEPFANGQAPSNGLMITNARHHDLLRRAIDAIASSESLLQSQASEELVVVGLHDALRYLGQITGETTSDQILGEIFSTFCIGK
jgi:tRNA modification GTPase